MKLDICNVQNSFQCMKYFLTFVFKFCQPHYNAIFVKSSFFGFFLDLMKCFRFFFSDTCPSILSITRENAGQCCQKDKIFISLPYDIEGDFSLECFA